MNARAIALVTKIPDINVIRWEFLETYM